MLNAFTEQQPEQKISKAKSETSLPQLSFGFTLSSKHNEIPDFTGFQRAGEKTERSQWIKTWGKSWRVIGVCYTYVHTHTQTHTEHLSLCCRIKKDQQNWVPSPPLIPRPCGAYTLKGNRYESNNHKNICSILTVAIKERYKCYENMKKETDLFRKLSLKKQQNWRVGSVNQAKVGVTGRSGPAAAKSCDRGGIDALWGTETSWSEKSPQKGGGGRRTEKLSLEWRWECLVFLLRALGSNGGFQAGDNKAIGAFLREWSFYQCREQIGGKQRRVWGAVPKAGSVALELWRCWRQWLEVGCPKR